MTNRLLLPEVTRLTELFDSLSPRPGSERTHLLRDQEGAAMAVGTYLRLSGRNERLWNGRSAIYGTANARLLRVIGENMLLVDRDQIYFEVIFDAQGRGLLIACHGRILGSRWLSESIEESSLPVWARRKEGKR